jgi:hypothetical protein
MSFMRLALCVPIVVATGCIPTHDYAGDYDMTYDVVMSPVGSVQPIISAGQSVVTVHHGLGTDYLVDLRTPSCKLEASYIEARDVDDWPYLEIAPQTCWYTMGNDAGTLPLSLSGTATYERDSERFAIVLAGSYGDDHAHGSATVEFTESY